MHAARITKAHSADTEKGLQRSALKAQSLPHRLRPNPRATNPAITLPTPNCEWHYGYNRGRLSQPAGLSL